jgi:hypothetical protein
LNVPWIPIFRQKSAFLIHHSYPPAHIHHPISQLESSEA